MEVRTLTTLRFSNIFGHNSLCVIVFRYNDINVQTFLHISTLLDPRFKDFPMTEGEEHLPTIKQELVKMVENEGSVEYDSKSNIIPQIDSEEPKKPRVSGLYSHFIIKYI